MVNSGTGSYFIQQSIGQHSVIGTFNAKNHSLRQGFIQPLPAIVLGGNPNVLGVIIWPNPFENGVVVNLESGLEDTIEMSLFDASGRRVQANTYESDDQLQIPLSNLAQGAYILMLSSGQKKTSKQLLKQ